MGWKRGWERPLHDPGYFRRFRDQEAARDGKTVPENGNSEVHFERELLLVLAGNGDFLLNNRMISLAPGDALFLDSWVPHQCRYPSNYAPGVHVWLHCRSQQLLTNAVKTGGAVLEHQPLPPLPGDLGTVIHRRWDRAVSPGCPPMLRTELYQSIVRLLQEELLWSTTQKQILSSEDELLRQLEAYLSVHYGHRMRLEELEQIFGRNRFYLMRLFKRKKKMTIGAYVNAARLKFVDAARRHGMTQKEIAGHLGFHSPAAFWHWLQKHWLQETPQDNESAEQSTDRAY